MQATTPTRHAPSVTIIGLGRMGERHLQTCIDLEVEINAVIDTDPDVCTAARRRGFRCASSTAAAPQSWFDGAYVIVAVPDTASARHAAKLSGAKRILIEKPSPRWIQALTAARPQTSETAAHVGLQERYNPAFGTVTDTARTQSGDLKTVTLREAVPQHWARRSPAGLAREVLVHDSDLMLRLVDATGRRILTWTVETATWNETPDIWELCCAVCFDLGDSTLLWEGTARWLREPAQLRRHLALTSNDLNIAADLRSGAVTTTSRHQAAPAVGGDTPPLRAQMSDWLEACEMTATLQDWQQALQIAAACTPTSADTLKRSP